MHGRRASPGLGGLRAKITLWFLVPTAIILGSVGLFVFTTSRRAATDLALTRSEDRARLFASQLSAEIDSYRLPLGRFAAEMSGASPGEVQRSLEAQWPVGSLSLFDSGVVVLDPQGRVIAAPSRFDIDSERLLETIRKPGVPVDGPLGLSNVLTDAVAGRDVVALWREAGDSRSRGLGWVVGFFAVERGATRGKPFYESIWSLYIGRQLAVERSQVVAGSELAYVVDGHGIVIFHPDTFLVLDEIGDQAPVAAVLSGHSGAMRTIGLAEGEVVAGYAPIPHTSWALVTEEPWEAVVEATQPYVRLMLGLLALGVLVPVIVVALGVRRITDPLAVLTAAAGRVAGGEFDHGIEVRTGDELELLAFQFNLMSAKLRASYAMLEQRVADRTRELATLNALAAVVSRSLELEEVMSAALAQTLAALEMEAGAAFRLDEAELILMADQGLSPNFVVEVSRLPLSASAADRALRTGAPVVREIDDYPAGRLRRLLTEEGLMTVISVPLVARGRGLGVLNLASRERRHLTDEERALLSAIGQQAGVAVENARLYAEAERTAAIEERNRLARDLHDAVSQTLFSASLIADVVPALWARDRVEAERQLVILRRLTRGALAEMRTLLLELRPAAMEVAELSTLLGHLGRASAGRGELEVQLDLDEISNLATDQKIALYRIAQEASNNVVKHANATLMTVRLRVADGQIEMEVCDDGEGFDRDAVPAGQLGMTTMRERASEIGATLTVDSRPGEGTCVSVTLAI